MKYVHQLHKTQFLPISLDLAWDFFSNPKNLGRITPPELDFKILSKNLSPKIYEGMEIDYTVKPLLRIPMKWKTKLCKIDSNKSFTDIQLKGPYKIWEHTHSFEIKENGVLMTDSLRYKLPMGFLGELMHRLFVRRKINYIFEYRTEMLDKLFKE